jgi:uncharacterized protein with HEPN domain
MTDEGRKYLSDILQSIELINQFTADIQNFNDFVSDKKTISAVERQLTIIGEAVHKFMKLASDHNITNAKNIYSLRNRLVHSYDSIDSSIIWAILKKHLQPLKQEVEQLMK